MTKEGEKGGGVEFNQLDKKAETESGEFAN
jgi:hypothetical protein